MEAHIEIEDGGRVSYFRKVDAEDRESLELRIEEVIESVVNNGYLDDTSEEKWIYVPPGAIKRIDITFLEEEDDGSRG